MPISDSSSAIITLERVKKVCRDAPRYCGNCTGKVVLPSLSLDESTYMYPTSRVVRIIISLRNILAIANYTSIIYLRQRRWAHINLPLFGCSKGHFQYGYHGTHTFHTFTSRSALFVVARQTGPRRRLCRLILPTITGSGMLVGKLHQSSPFLSLCQIVKSAKALDLRVGCI